MHWGLDYLFGLVDDRAEFTAFWAHTSATSVRRSSTSWRSRAAPPAVPGHARLPLRGLRADAPALARGTTRRRRRSGRRPAARRRAGRPVPGRPQGAGRRQPQLLDQEARAALHGRGPARERRHERSRQHHRLRRRDRGAPHRRRRRGAADARPGRRLQRLRLPLDPAAARLAAVAAPARRRRPGRARPAADPRRARAEPGVRRAGRAPRARRRPRPHARPDGAGARRSRDRLPPARSQDLLAGPLRPPPQPGRRVGRHPRRARRRARERRAGLGHAAARPVAVA